MEIERKFLYKTLPENLSDYPHSEITQGYLSADPAIRVREDGGLWYLTYKGAGNLMHEEYNLPLTHESYLHLLEKHDGRIIRKTRYRIPYDRYTIELDLFHGELEGTHLAEIEFETAEEAQTFRMPAFFLCDVTDDPAYKNVRMALRSN